MADVENPVEEGPRKIELSVPQTQFMASTAPAVVITGGVGSGKTFIGVVKSRYKIMERLPGAIVAPDFPHFARSTWPVMQKWLPWSHCTNRDLNHPYTKEQVLKFEFGGKEVLVWYGAMENVEAWTGMSINWFFFDEAKREKTRRAFDVLLSRLRVGKSPQGMVATTPLGMNHWLYDVCVKNDFPDEVRAIFEKAGYDRIVDWIRCKTKDNEKNLPATYIALLRALYTGKLALQELEGEFVTMEGAVWGEFSENPADGNVTEAAEYNDSVDVEWWVDDGFVEKHPRVILFAQEIPPHINVFDEYIVEGEYPEDTIKTCLAKPYRKPSLALVDSTAAVLRSKLWDFDIDTVKASQQDIEQGILHVGPFIHDGNGKRRLRIHPRCTRTIKAILGYVRDEDTLKPAKLGDDVPDAIRYGLWNKSISQLDEDAIPAEQKAEVVNNGLPPYWQQLSMQQQMIYRWSTQYQQSFRGTR